MIGQIAFDVKLGRPGCALLQASMGGLTGDAFAMNFPPETWLLHPTPNMGVYPIAGEHQLKQLVAMSIARTKEQEGK